MKFVIVSLLLICAILQCAAQNIPNINHKNKPRERKRRPNVQSDELESSAPNKRRPAVQDELEPSAPIRQRKPREDGLASSAPIKKQKKKPSAPREIHRNYNAVKFLSTYDTWPVANSCSKYDESENLYYNVSESRTAMLKWSNLVESSKNRWYVQLSTISFFLLLPSTPFSTFYILLLLIPIPLPTPPSYLLHRHIISLTSSASNTLTLTPSK